MVDFANVLNIDDDIIVGFDYDQLHKFTNEEFSYKYCEIEQKPTPTYETEELKQKVLGVYVKEMVRRISNKSMHPDEFEKYCQEWFEKNNKGYF